MGEGELLNRPGSAHDQVIWALAIEIEGHQDSDEHQLDSKSHTKRNVTSKVLMILLCDTSVREESGVLFMPEENKKMLEVNN